MKIASANSRVANPEAASSAGATPAAVRRITHRTRGLSHGSITRLVSPAELGALIKPFIFLDHISIESGTTPAFGWHPHSGIATLTLMLEGGFDYEDATGASGSMDPGAVEWLLTGGGIWHTGRGNTMRLKGYQLWVALPPEVESSPPFSQYLDQEQFPIVGPARIILGELGAARSPINAPSFINYFDVRLKAKEVWRYVPPKGHDVAWMALHEGRAMAGDRESISSGELVVFAKESGAIEVEAQSDTGFVLGSAAAHPFELHMGYYSVHTNRDALARGEINIERIGKELQRAGKL